MQKASNREAISKVRGLFKLQSTDTYVNITDRLILSELQSTALKFIKQTTDKRKLWNSPNIFKVIPCLKLEQVPLANCCSYVGNCTIAKSVVKLPKIAEGTNFGMLIQGLYSIDLVSRRFIESTPDRYVNSLQLGLKNSQIHFWIQEGFLYIGDDKIERVKISAYFEEDIPEDLIPYPSYCGKQLSKGCCPDADEISIYNQALCCPPNPYDDEFACPGYMVDDVISTVAQRLLQTYKRSAANDTSNARDETK
jgi:hypothetical protein